jgi:hypothetical protein
MEPSLSQDVILPHSLLHGVTTNDMRGSMQLCNCSIKNTCSCFNARPKRKCLCSITRNKNLATTYLIEYLFGGFLNETNYGCIHRLCIFKLRMITFFFKSHKNVHIPKMKFHAGNSSLVRELYPMECVSYPNHTPLNTTPITPHKNLTFAKAWPIFTFLTSFEV